MKLKEIEQAKRLHVERCGVLGEIEGMKIASSPNLTDTWITITHVWGVASVPLTQDLGALITSILRARLGQIEKELRALGVEIDDPTPPTEEAAQEAA